MYALYTMCVFVHIIAASVWIGAMVFFGAVVVLVVRRPAYANVFADLVRCVDARFRVLGWACVGVLFATGITNLALRGIGLSQLFSSTFWMSDFGHTLAFKLTFVSLAALATAAHDVLFGKRAIERVQRDPASAAARRSRRMASLLGRARALVSGSRGSLARPGRAVNRVLTRSRPASGASG